MTRSLNIPGQDLLRKGRCKFACQFVASNTDLPQELVDSLDLRVVMSRVRADSCACGSPSEVKSFPCQPRTNLYAASKATLVDRPLMTQNYAKRW